MKKAFQIFLKILASVLALLMLYALAIAVLSAVTIPEEPNHSPQIKLYLKTNGVHTDIVLPLVSEIKDWRKDISYTHTRGKDSTARWVGIGWGDRGFYLETPTWADLRASTAIRAATGLSTTAMHATLYPSMQPSPDSVPFYASDEQYQRLVHYIEASFKRNPSGKTLVIPTSAVYSDNDAFYEAKGRYSIFKSCNTWVNTGLKQAGLRACLWTPLDSPILSKYR